MSIWSLIISAIAAIFKAISETYFADHQIASEASARGRAEGATETAHVIAETADAQAAVATDSDPDAGILAKRLRARAAASRDRER